MGQGNFLKRKIFSQLGDWKENKKNKCLVVQGARQVGKTFAIKQFGASNYEEMLEINFKETPSAITIFSGDLSVDAMILAMRFRYPGKKLEKGRTLIFLDEIQECPEAITSLKFWAIDNGYDVIASGSLLGIDYKRASSYPVGYVDYIKMFGLDFEEFLWATGIDEARIKELDHMFIERRIVPKAINDVMMAKIREYIAIGGMPEVVFSYVNNRDFRTVDKIQRQILLGYQYDIAHYAVAEEKLKAEKCYLSLAKQLLDKENHKFQYKEVEHNGKAQKYYSSIEWLLRADIVALCHLVRDVSYDLNEYSRPDFFRAYTTDLSLLIGMKEYGMKQHVVENTLTSNTKGGLYECLIADILLKKDLPLYFYKNETKKKEIDFLVQKDGQLIPIEVKGGNGKASSLNWLMSNKDSIPVAYKFIDGNVGVNENRIVTMPIYMAMFL